MPFITVPIDGGLDLVTPPVSVQPGRMQDCENFEVALNQGAKSIDGYERFDGGPSPSSTSRSWSVGVQGVINPTLRTQLGDGTWVGGYFTMSYKYQQGATQSFIVRIVATTYDGFTNGVVVFTTSNSADSIILNKLIPGVDLDYSRLNPGATTLTNGAITGAYFMSTIGTYSPATVNEQIAIQSAYYTAVRPTIQEVPGQSSVLGLFWLKDELYACRDYFALAFDTMANEDTPSYNDELFIGASYATATWTGFLAKIVITGGTGLTNSQSGLMMFYNTSGTATLATIKNHSAGDIDVATVTEVNSSSQGAGLYRADGTRGDTVATQSWTHQEIGYRIRYKDGAAEFVPANRINPTQDIASLIQETDWFVPDTIKATGGSWIQGGTWSAFPSADGLWTNDGDTSYFGCLHTAGGALPPFWVNNFGLSDTDLPDGSTVTGFTVEVVRRAYTGGTATGNIRDYVIQLKFAPDSGVTGTTASFADRFANWPTSSVTPDPGPPYLTYATKAYGGAQSLLGYGGVSPDAVKSTDFGFYMNTECVGFGAGTVGVQSRITMVRLKVHFVPPQSKIYFWNGTSAVLAEVVMPYQTSGSVANTDAKGHLFLMDVGTNRAVEADEEIRTYPGPGVTPDGGAGDGSTLIAMTENSMSKNVMDWSSLMTKNGKVPDNAKYQYDVSNFYAAADFDAIYGVSGAGPAFMYDGYAFTRIYTGTPEQDDIPRHCAVHQSRLFLGYRSGSVQFSVAGNPLSFDPLQFAGEIGVGAAVRGLMELNGDTLAEITQKGVSMIQGDVGLGPYPGIISPDVGCVEYSAQSMGQFMYTSFRGIQNLRATQSYGDFDTSQFSWDVWSFLRPRVQTSAFFESANIGVINSLAVRNKSQYRLMFADGKQLTATFLREGEMPQYTIQQYYHANGTTPLTWDVVTAGVESNGRDRLFGATNDGTGYVYEIDRGYSFDGGNIAGYFVMAIDDQRSPAQDKAFPDMHIYGIATDYAAFTMSRGVNYQDPNPTYNYPQRFGSLTAVPTGEEAYGVSNTPVRNFGANISFRFDVNSNSQPPVTIQAISYYITPAGQKRT